MTPQDFTYWLQGFFELTDSDSLDKKQTKMVKEHLALVFKKVTKTKINKKSKNESILDHIEYCSTRTYPDSDRKIC